MLYFVTSFKYPTQYAHPVHGLEMARAWSKLLGEHFCFVVESCADDSLNGVRWRRAFGHASNVIHTLHLRTVAYFFFLAALLWGARGERPTVFVNDIRIAISAALLRRVVRFRFVFESHGVYGVFQERLVYSVCDNAVFVTAALQARAEARYPRLRGRTTLAPNAVDMERFNSVHSPRSALRTELALPTHAYLIGYIGRFMPGGIDKGVSFMIDALSQLPAKCVMLFVGGTEAEIDDMSARADAAGVLARVIFVSFTNQQKAAAYAMACDVLAYVPSDISSRFHTIETSPMKLFEYMAARRPIVVSDTPSNRAILDDSSALFCTPGNQSEFCAQVVRAIETDTHQLVDAAYRQVAHNTWDARAKKIYHE